MIYIFFIENARQFLKSFCFSSKYLMFTFETIVKIPKIDEIENFCF